MMVISQCAMDIVSSLESILYVKVKYCADKYS